MVGEAVEWFDGDDAGYLDWLKENPSGYVVNTRRPTPYPNYVVFHSADCGFISHRMGQPGAWTERSYSKICSLDVESLRPIMREIGRKDGSFSKICSRCAAAESRGRPNPK